jgi:hypothetical protein
MKERCGNATLRGKGLTGNQTYLKRSDDSARILFINAGRALWI